MTIQTSPTSLLDSAGSGNTTPAPTNSGSLLDQGANSGQTSTGKESTPQGGDSNKPGDTAPTDQTQNAGQGNSSDQNKTPTDPKDSKEAGQKTDAGEKKPGGAPEKYEDFKLPEGIALDDAKKTAMQAAFKEMDLSQEQAQKLVDLQSQYALEQQKAAVAQYAETVENWKNESIQELGANYKEKLAFAAKARDQFGTPALREMLNQTGLANHKEMVNFLIKVGQAISEDTLPEGGGGGGRQDKSLAELLYPSMKKAN